MKNIWFWKKRSFCQYQPNITMSISKQFIVTSLVCGLPAWGWHPATSASLLWGSSGCSTQRKVRERQRHRGERSSMVPSSRLEPRSNFHWTFPASLSCLFTESSTFIPNANHCCHWILPLPRCHLVLLKWSLGSNNGWFIHSCKNVDTFIEKLREHNHVALTYSFSWCLNYYDISFLLKHISPNVQNVN